MHQKSRNFIVQIIPIVLTIKMKLEIFLQNDFWFLFWKSDLQKIKLFILFIVGGSLVKVAYCSKLHRRTSLVKDVSTFHFLIFLWNFKETIINKIFLYLPVNTFSMALVFFIDFIHCYIMPIKTEDIVYKGKTWQWTITYIVASLKNDSQHNVYQYIEF